MTLRSYIRYPMTRIEFFFDCSSPWTYFAFTRIIPMASELGISIRLRPILVGKDTQMHELMIFFGTMGGIFRDVLCNEQPIVFSSPLYATVSWGGSLLFILLLQLNLDAALSATIAGACIFIARLLAIKLNISLPKFRFPSAVNAASTRYG